MRYLALSSPENEVPDWIYPKTDHNKRALVDEYLDWQHTGLRAGSPRLVFKKYFNTLRS
jgi:hypothetical protein